MRYIASPLLAMLIAYPAFAQDAGKPSYACSVEIPAGVQEALKKECTDIACYERLARELKLMVVTFAVTSETYKNLLDAITTQPQPEPGPKTSL